MVTRGFTIFLALVLVSGLAFAEVEPEISDEFDLSEYILDSEEIIDLMRENDLDDDYWSEEDDYQVSAQRAAESRSEEENSEDTLPEDSDFGEDLFGDDTYYSDDYDLSGFESDVGVEDSA